MTERGTLTRARIFRAALDLVDREGLPALNMRRLGLELGVEAMALYRHIANKRAILDGIVEVALAELEAPDRTGKWTEDLCAIFRSLRRLLQIHPNILPLVASRPFSTPRGLEQAEMVLELLKAQGLEEQAALSCLHALLGFTVGYAWLEAGGFVGEMPESAPLVRTNLPSSSRSAGPLIPGVSAYPEQWDHEIDFEIGLRLLVEGVISAGADPLRSQGTPRGSRPEAR